MARSRLRTGVTQFLRDHVVTTTALEVGDAENLDTLDVWLAPTVIDSGNGLVSVSCASSGFCVAVRGTGQALSYDGTSWTVPTTIDGGYLVKSVSCVSTTFCMAVDQVGNVLNFTGLVAQTISVSSTAPPLHRSTERNLRRIYVHGECDRDLGSHGGVHVGDSECVHGVRFDGAVRWCGNLHS